MTGTRQRRRRMLQQNNNNNHPCLDMTHRELLHDCRRPSVSFTSALEFGAIPLIKGLRAWAVSGGYSKSRRKAAAGPQVQSTCQQPPENRAGQRGWSGRVSSGYGQSLESTASTARTPGVRQGGLGALVTVATLKGTEGGGRQTQTRCLFLKAQGRGNYICAVGNRRVAGARTHTVILEGEKEEVRCSSRRPRVNQDGTDESGALRAKPRAIRKWRKGSKSTGSGEKKTRDLTREIINSAELVCDDKNNTVISDEAINRTSDNTTADRITQCQTEDNEMKGGNTSLTEQQSQEDMTEMSKDKRAQSPISMHTVAPESMDLQTSCSSAKPCANTAELVEVGMTINPFDDCCPNDDAQGDTEINTSDNDLDANDENIETNNKDGNFVADVPNSEEASVVSESAQTTINSLRIELTTKNCNTDPSIGHPPIQAFSEGPVNYIQENQDQESRTDECSLNCENQHSGENVTNTTQRGGTAHTKISIKAEGCTGHGCTPAGGACSTTERPPMCSPQHWEELISEYEKLEVQQSDNSSQQGFSTPTADITVTSIQSQPNPAPTTTAAIATAIPALSMQEVGARGGDLLPLVNSELLSELARADDRDKVAAARGALDEGEGEEDEFGVFMQAGGEQFWTAGFTEHQQLAAGEDYSSGQLKSCADANEPTSWKSDWTFQQSESTWVAFSQESVEQKIAPDGQWWPSTVDKPSLSTIHDVSSVFLEAFPSENPSCEDPDDIPTLTQLLQGPAAIGNTGHHREQNLLDGLQDLDRMIGLKYKRAESVSCKLLLQSLHLERPTSERVTVRVKSSARFSPNLPTSNQQLAASAKRRLSYDFNRNITT